MRLYVDGKEVATQNIAGSVMDYTPATDLKIGVFADDNEGHYLDGKIADVRLWDSTRTAAEIADNMSGFVASDSVGLVGNWRLDDEASGVATTAADATGNYDGTVLGGPSYTSDAAPIYGNDISVTEDTFYTGFIAAEDASSGALTFAVDTAGDPDHGTLSIDAATGEFIYTPDADYFGTDVFTVKVIDANGAISTQQISVSIEAAADAPTILGASDAQIFVQLDGEDDYLQILDNGFDLDPGKDDFTFEAWIDLAALSGDQILFDKRGGFGTGIHAFIDSSGYVNLEIGDGMQLNAGASSSGTVDADGWHHVAISVDRDGNTEFYIDGMLSGSGDVSNTADLILSNSEPMLIGKSYSNNSYLQGAIDEIRFWNEARSDFDISQNYATKIANPAGEAALAGYWNFDNIDTHDEGYAGDLSANGNRLYAGDPLLDGEDDTASGETVNHLIRASDFNGTSSNVDLSAHAAALSTGSGSFTYEAWIKTTATADGEILTIGDNPGTNSLTQFRTLANGTVTLQVLNGGAAVSSGTVNDGLWHHVAVRYDAATGMANLIIDGVEDGSAAVSPNLGTSLAYIGQNAAGNAHFFDGEIADVRIWDYARDTGDIASAREKFPQPDEEGLLAHYKLDGADGSAISDSSIQGYDGTSTVVQATEVAAPVFSAAITMDEDQSFTGSIGAIDPDGATTLTFTAQNDTTTTNGGTVSVTTDGLFTYTPADGYIGADSFDVTVADAEGNESTQSIKINTAAYNDPPALLGVASTSGGIQFDGVDDKVAVADAANLRPGTGSQTMEVWFYWDGSANELDSNTQFLMAKGNLAGGWEGTSIFLSDLNGTPELNVRVATTGTGGTPAVSNAAGQSLDISGLEHGWHHVALVLDQSQATGSISGYLDGSSSGWTDDATNGSTFTSTNIDVTSGVIFGQSQTGSANKSWYIGQMDEARIWSEARSAEDIAENYQQRLESTVDTTNLEGYWRFDQITEDGKAIDLSGNENDAIVGHGAPVDAFAPTLSFNGSTDEITTASPPPVSGSHTVEAWYKTTASGTVAIMSTEDANADSRNAMQIYVNNGQPNLEVAGTGGLDVFTLSANATNDGEWHHIAYSYDASSQTFAAYLDGAPAGGTLTTNQDIGTFTPDGNLQIGINRLGSTNFNGEISDVRVWDDIRTSTEIADNYTSRLNGAEADLAAYYRLDQDGTDSTANGNDGTLTGTTLNYPSTSPTPIPFARSLELDGTDDYISINGAPVSMSAITYEAWIKPDTVSAYGNIVSKASDGGGTSFIIWPDGRLGLQTDGVGWTYSTSTVAANEWQHVAVSYDPAAAGGTMTFYINGQADNAITGVGGTIDPSTLFAVGSQSGASASNLFNGNIADVRVWENVRTVNDIREGMNGYIDPETPGLVSNWRLNDDLGTTTAGDTILDSAGDNSGTVVGDPQFVDGAAPVYSYEFSTDEDIAVHGSLVATDAEAAGLTFTLAQGAGHGTVSIDSDGDFIYTPADNYSGADSFKVKVSDGSATITRTISVSVAAENDAPQILGAQTTSGAVQFDGDDDYIQVDHHEDLNPGAGSFSVQLMADFRDTSSPQSLISKGNQTSSYEGWNVFIESGYLYARMGDGGSDPSAKAELRYDLTGIDGWHEVSFVLDRDAGTFEAYFDGNPDGWVETAGRDNDPSGWDISNYGPLLMGETIDGTLQAKTSIDEVRIWNKALSANDIANTTNSTLNGSEQNLVAYWQFEPDQLDQGTGIFTDLTSNGHDAELGTIVPGDGAEPQFLIPPVQAMSFDGDDKIVVLDNDQLSTGTNDFSVEAWVYRDTMGTENVIIDNRDSAYKGWMLGVSDNDTLELAMEDANGNTSNVFSTATIPSGQWVHVAVTADRGGDATFYVNGVAGGTASIQNTPGSLTAVSNLLIGDTDTSGSTYGGWNGMLSDVRIWDHVRDASDIGSDNFGHLQLPHPGLVGNWRLDEVSDTGTADDYSGHENHGAVTGATSVVTAQNIYGTELTLDEDTPLVGILQATDAEGDAVTWALDTGPVNGQLSLLSNGTFKYVPDDNYAGSDSFTATVTDANGASRSQIFSVTVGERVDAPQLLGVSAQETVLQFDGENVLNAGRGSGDALAITSDVTVEMWIQPSVLKLAHLLSFGSTSETLAGNVLYSLEMQPDGALRFFHENSSLGNETPTTTATPLVAGEWAHVAATRDTDAGTVSFYVNGELLETIAYATEPAGGTISELYFGALDLPSDYEGLMDEVRVWNSVRTEAEIADTYQRKLSGAEIETATDLVGYWDFDETSSDGAYTDLSGSGADAKPDTIDGISDHLAGYASFDGVDDNIVIPNDGSQSAGSITIETWFRADPDGTGLQRIITKEDDGGGDIEYTLYLDGNGYLRGESSAASLSESVDLRDGEWHHAALVVESGIIGAGNSKLYLDGVEVDNSGLGVLVPAPSSSKPVMVGDYDDDDDYAENFLGDIADVRIWDDVRSAGEISANMTTVFTSSEAGLVGYYRLDDATGTTATDASSTANDGTLQNGAAIAYDNAPLEVPTGNGLYFDGNDSGVQIPHSADFQLTSEYTIGAWIKPDALSGVQRIIAQEAETTLDGFSFALNDDGLRLSYYGQEDLEIPASTLADAGVSLKAGQWAHVAVSIDSDYDATFFVNGIDVGTIANTVTPTFNVGEALRIGSAVNSTPEIFEEFTGVISNVGLWSSTFNEAQVRDEINGMLDPSAGNVLGYWPLNDGAGTEISDLSGNGNTGTISGASWIDTGPEIYADQTNMLEGGLLRGNLGVIDGDAGETFTFDVTDDAHFGELTVDAVTGAYSYRPVPNFTGEDSFTIRVTDSDGLSSEKTITFEVDNLRNNAPVADGYDGGAHISLADTETVVLPGVTTIQADFTIETWFRADGSQDDGDILFSTVGGTHDFGVKFNASGGLDGYVRDVDSAGPAVNVLDGEWHHVALRYTGSSGDFEIVVDGQAGSTEMKSFTNVGDLTFGDAAAGMGLVGDIDEVRYWNTLRSDEDIALNMHTTVDPGTPGLTTYLRADEGAGTTVADLTGNGNHATVPSGSLVTDQESTLALSHTGRSSLSFSDANGSMADAGSITVPSDRLSLTFWANVTASATENRIMEINDLSGSSPNPLMVSVGDEGEVIVEIYDGTTNITLSSDAGWTYNEWSHFGVSYDGDVLELYIDGQLAGAEDASALDMSGVTGNMYMGMNIDAEAAGFNGELSNVQLWDRDVSEADVRAAMLGRVPAAGNNEVLGYWPFDDGLTGFAYDASGNGHTVSLSNVGVSVDVPPQPGNASGMEFDGASGFVKIAHDGAGDNPLALKGDMTVEFWINPDSFGGGRVFSFSGEVATDGEPDNSLYELYITTGGNVQWVQEKEGGTDASPAVFTSTGITVDTWSHVALTRDAAAQTVTLYVNGSAVGSPLSYPDHPTGGENGELFLGVNGAMQHFFDGQIADFRVWNDVRTPAEISAGLSHELVGGEQGLAGYWPLSEGGGNVVHDLSPNAADGDIRGGTSWVDAGHLVTEVDTALEGRVFAHDMDGDALTFTVETDAVNGTVSMDADGTYAYTPDTSYSGPDSFTVKVVDADGAVDYTTVTVSTLGEVTWLGGDVGGADDVSLVGNWTGGLPDAYTLATIGDTANPPMLTTLGGFPDDIMTVGALSNTGPDDFAVASGTILYLAQPVTSEISGGSLTLNGTVTGDGSMSFGASSTFNFVEGTISTAGPVVVNGTANITGSAVRTVDTNLILAGTTTFGSNATINGTGKVDISGTVTASGTGSTISNNVYIAPNGTLQITAAAGNNMDLTGSSVINAGLILLGGSSTNILEIDVPNTALQNDGTIQFTNTGSSGGRTLRGDIINNGIIDVDANASLLISGTNDLFIDSRNGTIDIASDATLSIASSSSSKDEILVVGPNTILTGDGTLNMTYANQLQIDGSFVYTADMPEIILGSQVDIVSYDGSPVTFTVAEGATLDITNIEFDSQVTLINNGTLISTGAADILGPFVNMEGAEYNISAETTLTYLDFGDSVTNYGSIHINEPDSSTSFIQFNVFGSRQFVNHGSFSITQDGGSTTSTATINADIHNYGIMTFDRDVDVNAPGTPVHTNAGLLTLANGAVLAFKGTDDFTNLEGGVITGNGTLDFSATGTVFQNDGFIDVAGLTVETVDNLQIIGDMVATDSSEILLDIGNDGDEVGDSLTVTGQMTLNGTLEAYFISGYSPVVGDVFNVVSFATATAGSYFDAIRGLEGDGSTLLDIDIDTSFGLVSLTAVANAITATSGSDSYVGSSMADHVYGGDGDDILDGDGGEDVLLGGAGNDVIKISDNDFHFVDGGEGTDTLVAHNGLDMSQVRNDLISGFEVLDIGFGDLTLDGEDVVSITDGTNALTGTGNTLVVTRQDFGGAIDIGAGWGETTSTTLTVDGELRTFDKQVHAATGATIYIEHVAENLTEMTDAEGFTLTGEDTYDYAGWALSSAGDINGDGFEDFIVGAYYADRNQTGATADTGAAYVVFGAASGLSDIDLTSIASGDGTNGFKLEGGSALDFAGASVSKLGDVNGDGIDDIIIGAPGNSYSSEGAAYVVFGKTSGFNGAYDLDALGSDGFKITGAAVDDYTGEAVAGGGDINGDGLNDIIIGAPQDSGSSGKAFVIYGATTLGANITTAAATTIINGIDADDSAGLSVSIAGDLNGDGYDDVVIGGSGGDGLANGTANAGEAYVLFGKAGGLDANVNLSSLQAGDGSTGFTLTSNQAGSLLGLSVAMLGDINGDGFSDMAINAPNADSIYDNTGSAYVVFGKAGGYAATLNVDTLSGSDGFEIIGDGMDAYLGGMNTLSSAGDINGDGLNDIIVSAPSANYGSGAAYVVFGSRDGYAASMSLTDLTPDQGFVLEGANVDADSIGFAASAAGDINGDGFDDILIGSYDYYSGGAGVTYVVYGGDFTGDVDTTGSENDDVLIGTSGNDTLDGGESGADVLRGGAGDDVLIIGSENFARIDGGTGQDTLYLNGGFDLDLSAIANNMVTGIEHIDMNNEMANVLDIDFASVLDIGEAIDQLVGEANMLVVSMDETDTINWIGNWTEREEQPAAAASQGYTVFDSDDSNASVAVQNSMPGGGLA